MKKSNIVTLVLAVTVLFMAACGGGGAEKVELSEKGELLISKTWAPDLNATLKENTAEVDSTTGIEANIQLGGDVAKGAQFLAGTLVFGRDKKDASKLSYKRTWGKGILSTSVTGYWSFNEDESAIIMKEWDSMTNAEKDPVTWTIIELTEEKFVFEKEGALGPETFVAQ